MRVGLIYPWRWSSDVRAVAFLMAVLLASGATAVPWRSSQESTQSEAPESAGPTWEPTGWVYPLGDVDGDGRTDALVWEPTGTESGGIGVLVALAGPDMQRELWRTESGGEGILLPSGYDFDGDGLFDGVELGYDPVDFENAYQSVGPLSTWSLSLALALDITFVLGKDGTALGPFPADFSFGWNDIDVWAPPAYVFASETYYQSGDSLLLGKGHAAYAQMYEERRYVYGPATSAWYEDADAKIVWLAGPLEGEEQAFDSPALQHNLQVVTDLDGDGVLDFMLSEVFDVEDPVFGIAGAMLKRHQAVSGGTSDVLWTSALEPVSSQWAWFDIVGEVDGNPGRDYAMYAGDAYTLHAGHTGEALADLPADGFVFGYGPTDSAPGDEMLLVRFEENDIRISPMTAQGETLWTSVIPAASYPANWRQHRDNAVSFADWTGDGVTDFAWQMFPYYVYVEEVEGESSGPQVELVGDVGLGLVDGATGTQRWRLDDDVPLVVPGLADGPATLLRVTESTGWTNFTSLSPADLSPRWTLSMSWNGSQWPLESLPFEAIGMGDMTGDGVDDVGVLLDGTSVDGHTLTPAPSMGWILLDGAKGTRLKQQNLPVESPPPPATEEPTKNAPSNTTTPVPLALPPSSSPPAKESSAPALVAFLAALALALRKRRTA